MFKGFKEFIFRGNVLDLAIAVVMGTAFTAVVTAIVTSVIKPLINSIAGKGATGLGVFVVEGKQNTYIDLAAVINAIINFVIIAAVVYFVLVLPVQRILARRRKNVEADAEIAATESELLAEIRDLLRAQNVNIDAGAHGMGTHRADS